MTNMCANTNTNTTIGLPKCLNYAVSQHLMLWNEVVSNGLVVTGVLVLVSQMVFVSKVPTEMSRECRNAGGGMGGGWEIGKLGNL